MQVVRKRKDVTDDHRLNTGIESLGLNGGDLPCNKHVGRSLERVKRLSQKHGTAMF
jgi:hypothetical protein